MLSPSKHWVGFLNALLAIVHMLFDVEQGEQRRMIAERVVAIDEFKCFAGVANGQDHFGTTPEQNVVSLAPGWQLGTRSGVVPK